MHADKVRLSDIRYNPEREGFEARVAVHERGTVWLYPAFVPAPMNAEFALVSRGLSQAAIKAHRSARPGLRLRRSTQVETRLVA